MGKHGYPDWSGSKNVTHTPAKISWESFLSDDVARNNWVLEILGLTWTSLYWLTDFSVYLEQRERESEREEFCVSIFGSLISAMI